MEPKPRTRMDRTLAKLWHEYVMQGPDAEAFKDKIPENIAYEYLEFEPEPPTFDMMRRRYRLSVLRGWLYDKIARFEEARMAPLRNLVIIGCAVLSLSTCGVHWREVPEVAGTVVGSVMLSADQKAAQKALAEQAKRETEITADMAKESPELSFLDKHWRFSDRELAVYNKLPDDDSKRRFKVLNDKERHEVVTQIEAVIKQAQEQEQAQAQYQKQLQQQQMQMQQQQQRYAPQAAPMEAAPAPAPQQ